MARCDEGYLCTVCGGPVDTLPESLLYLRHLLGEIPLEELHRYPECHIRCCPEVAQYIVHEEFPPVNCEGPFAKANLLASDCQAEEDRLTKAWTTLHSAALKGLPFVAMPRLPK